MGCGKSSVGRELSKLLCCPFMDLDDVIAESEGRSIQEIFAADGETAFRRMELETLSLIIQSSQKGDLKQSLPSQVTGPSLCGQRGCTVSRPPSDWITNDCKDRSYPSDVERVLALGGGTVMTPECAELVKANTLCVYLRASVDTLLEHLSGEVDGRPMLKGESLRSRIEDLMALRAETYEHTAHVIIDTDDTTIDVIAEKIKSI